MYHLNFVHACIDWEKIPLSLLTLRRFFFPLKFLFVWLERFSLLLYGSRSLVGLLLLKATMKMDGRKATKMTHYTGASPFSGWRNKSEITSGSRALHDWSAQHSNTSNETKSWICFVWISICSVFSWQFRCYRCRCRLVWCDFSTMRRTGTWFICVRFNTFTEKKRFISIFVTVVFLSVSFCSTLIIISPFRYSHRFVFIGYYSSLYFYFDTLYLSSTLPTKKLSPSVHLEWTCIYKVKNRWWWRRKHGNNTGNDQKTQERRKKHTNEEATKFLSARK